MLVICGGGMRTGSVAIYQMMREVVLLTGGEAPTTTNLMDNAGRWAATDHWVLYKQHGLQDVLKPHLDRVRVVVTFRNQLDVIVSLMHFRGDSFKGVLMSQACYSNIDAYHSWYRALPFKQRLSVRYEEGVVDNQNLTVGSIANFLGVDLHPQQIGHIVNKWSIDANLRRARQKNALESEDYMAERHIYSKGRSRWQEELSDQQVQAALKIRKIRRWQKEMDYEPQ